MSSHQRRRDARQLIELGGDIATAAALEHVRLPAALVDKDGVIRWQNRASTTVTSNVVGTSFVDVVAPDDIPVARDILTRILSLGEPADFSLRVRSATGEYELRHYSAAPIRRGESVVGIIGLIVPPLDDAGKRPKTRQPAPELTRRQHEILHLLAEGKSTQEIADQLGLSPTTVRNYAANLIAAFGAHTRLQAVVAASRAGLLDL